MYSYNPFQWTAMNQWSSQNPWTASQWSTPNQWTAPWQTQTQWPAYASSAPQTPYAQPAQFSQGAAPALELTQWLARIEGQINMLSQTIQSHVMASNISHGAMMSGAFAPAHSQTTFAPSMYNQMAFGPAMSQNTTGLNNSPIRLRESDTHIFCDIFLPQITMGDIEVEVSGNRILCRTRVPVPSFVRQFSGMWNAPRGFEFFELPDGRLECSWLCPVLFHAKDVEATFREGFISICVPKAETTTPRQTVKVTQEKASRRTASEMNS